MIKRAIAVALVAASQTACLPLAALNTTQPMGKADSGLREIRYIEVPTGPVTPPRVVEVPAPAPTHPLPTDVATAAPAPLAPASLGPKQTLKRALNAATYDDGRGRFVQGRQVYPYFDGAAYAIYATPRRIVDVRLQPGEQILSANAGDTLNWRLEPTLSGAGDSRTVHLFIKPIADESDTNLVVTTDQRTYNLELRVAQAGKPFHHSVSWTYPDDQRAELRSRIEALHQVGRRPRPGEPNGPDVAGRYTVVGNPAESVDEALARLNFGWTVEDGKGQWWLPKEIYDDGARVVLRFAPDITRRQMPVLSLLTDDNQIEIVNYIQNGTALIVPYLFDRAMLYMSGDPRERVIIARTGIWTHGDQASN